MSLHDLLKQPGIWRGRDHGFHHAHGAAPSGLPTGHAALDTRLPGGGWPRGALTEILHGYPGQGELRLLTPALSQLTQRQHHIALIAPPWHPYAPGFVAAGIDLDHMLVIVPERAEDRLWALEQTLRGGHCRAVLAWPDRNIPDKALRRLQLAAETGNASGFLFRHENTRRQHSPAALRLLLRPPHGVEIIKCRGKHIAGTIALQPGSNNKKQVGLAQRNPTKPPKTNTQTRSNTPPPRNHP